MLNRTIWLLWLQGWNDVPWLVEQVAESWVINNPNWNIEYVTFDNLRNYVNDIDYIYDESKEIGLQHKADIIRLSLLKNHGGVWADATMLCMQPLDVWIDDAVKPAGLWMYHGNGAGMHGRNGPAIWLIASEKNSLMINQWKRACDQYWKNRTEADSYFWLDGLFRKLYESDTDFKARWERAPHLYCELRTQAHALARRNGMSSNNQALQKIFRDKPPYTLKFWWKEWQDKFPDIESPECQKSNGYVAIQMSKRKFEFKHEMDAKTSLVFNIKIFMQNIMFLVRQQTALFLRKWIKPLLIAR